MTWVWPDGVTFDSDARELRVYGQFIPIGVALNYFGTPASIFTTWTTENNGWYITVTFFDDGSVIGFLPGDPTPWTDVDSIMTLYQHTINRTGVGTAPDGMPPPVDPPPDTSDPYGGMEPSSWIGFGLDPDTSLEQQLKVLEAVAKSLVVSIVNLLKRIHL